MATVPGDTGMVSLALKSLESLLGGRGQVWHGVLEDPRAGSRAGLTDISRDADAQKCACRTR